MASPSKTASPIPKPDRGSPDALRHLRARELRRGLPRHGDDPRSARQLAQYSSRQGPRAPSAPASSWAASAAPASGRSFRATTQPSLAIALGGLGMTLKDLTALYAGLAEGGEPVTLSWRREAKPASNAPKISADVKKRRLLSPVAAWYVSDILKDAPPPPGHERRRHRLQDRHLLRLSRCLGRSATTASTRHRRVGRPPGRRIDAGPDGPHRRRADPVRRLRPHLGAPHAVARRTLRRHARSRAPSFRRR